MSAESQMILHEIEVAFLNANQMKEKCKNDAIKKINRLKDLYPNEADEIGTAFLDLCEKYSVDLYSELRISDEEINNFVENNVPLTDDTLRE